MHSKTIETGRGPGPERALEITIGQFKQGGDFAGLVTFLRERVAEITRAGDAPDLLSRLNNELGVSLLELEEFPEAVICLDKAEVLDPENLNAAYNRANFSLYHKDLEDALVRYGRILKKNGSHVGATYNAALCHALRGRVKEALPLFERVTTLEPGYAGAHFWAGECLLDQGKPGDALIYFRAAATLNPDHPESVRGLAICLFHGGEFEEAMGRCDDMLARSGPELMALRVKGDCLLALNRPGEAAECHIHMAAIDFDAREYVMNRARFLAEAEPEKAHAYIKLVLTHFPEFEPSLGKIQEDLPVGA
jgi:tetratricopeptide (TPR) repeat protein